MRNDLLKSVFIVVGFWLVVSLIIWPPRLNQVGPTLVNIGLIWVGGLLLGAASWLLWMSFRRDAGRTGLAKSAARASMERKQLSAVVLSDPRTMKTSPVPTMESTMEGSGDILSLALTKEGKESARAALERMPFWPQLLRKHPSHAAALVEIYAILLLKRDLPAGPNPSDHGGLTLVEHTHNVLAAMQELVPTWRYTGVLSRRKEVAVPLYDLNRGYHAFEPDDPLTILTAIAHDIGKVVCYRQTDPKNPRLVIEVKSRHGEVGAQLLRTVPSLRGLPPADRQAIILAVEYYHAMFHMPYGEWMGDLPRSLTGLLYEADCLASFREGNCDPSKAKAGSVRRATNEPDAPLGESDEEGDDSQAPSAQQATFGAQASQAFKAMESAQSARRDARSLPTEPPTEMGGDGSTPSERVPYWQGALGPDLVSELRKLLMRPGAMDEKSGTAFAHYGEPYIYVADSHLRAQLKSFGVPTENPRGQLTGFTKELLFQLEALDLLRIEFDGKPYTHKTAIWKCSTSGDPTGKYLACFGVDAKILPAGYAIHHGIRHSKIKPFEVLLGRQVAIKSQGTGAVETGETVGSAEVSTEVDKLNKLNQLDAELTEVNAELNELNPGEGADSSPTPTPTSTPTSTPEVVPISDGDEDGGRDITDSLPDLPLPTSTSVSEEPTESRPASSTQRRKVPLSIPMFINEKNPLGCVALGGISTQKPHPKTQQPLQVLVLPWERATESYSNVSLSEVPEGFVPHPRPTAENGFKTPQELRLSLPLEAYEEARRQYVLEASDKE